MKKGFTLAEMTMVTAIIGVITVICITPVINNAQNKEWSALTKKAVTTMQDAIDLKLAGYGWPADGANITFFQWLTRNNEYEKSSIDFVEKDSSNLYLKTKNNIAYFFLSSEKTNTCLKTPTNNSIVSDSAECTICIDINGNEGPTSGYNTSNWQTKLKPKYQETGAKDIVCARIKEGTVGKSTNTNAGYKRFEEYMYNSD